MSTTPSEPRVVCHIGNYKTGTTSLQRFLREHEESLLRPAGFRYPRGWLRRDKVVELQLALMRTDRLSIIRSRSDEWRDPAFRLDLVRQIRADLARHPDVTTVLSGELIANLRHDDELEALRDVIGDARIVVYWRDAADWLAAMADQLIKDGIEPTYGGDVDAFTYLGDDSWQVEYAKRTATWQRHFTDVVALGYDEAVLRDGSVIPSFLEVLGVETPDDATMARYWINQRGTNDREFMIDGNRRENGLEFGMTPRR